jgi:uncharacterized peroxidase-related enzyme
MARITVIGPEEAGGELAKVYRRFTKSRGKLANVHMIASLNPKAITAHMDLYMTVMFGSSPLSRAEREMMGVVVSAANRCAYCVEHHSQALLHFWKDAERLAQLAQDYAADPELTDRQAALCRYAEAVTLRPESDDVPELIARLRALGLEDRAILDASLVAAYFNFVNRLVLSLGVQLETDAGGYKYE